MADTAFRGVGGPGGWSGGGGGGGSISGDVGGGSGEIPWASKAGHIETVFSCEHRPGDPDTLATGSYGSSVKVWHVPTMDLKVRALVGIGPDGTAGSSFLLIEAYTRSGKSWSLICSSTRKADARTREFSRPTHNASEFAFSSST